MVIARSVSEIHDLKVDDTTFHLRTLSHKILMRLNDIEGADQMEMLVRAGVAGWTNLLDKDGKAVAAEHEDATVAGFSITEALTPLSMDAIPFQVLAQLATETIRCNRMNDDDVKNS